MQSGAGVAAITESVGVIWYTTRCKKIFTCEDGFMEDIVRKNNFGEIVLFVKPSTGKRSFAKSGATNIQLANKFVEENREELGLSQSLPPSAITVTDKRGISKSPTINFEREKTISGTSVVIYTQSLEGLPVFNAQLGVQINNDLRSVMSVQSSMHAEIKVLNSEEKDKSFKPKKLGKTAFEKMSGLNTRGFKSAVFNRQLVYRYVEDERLDLHSHNHDEGTGGCFGGSENYVPKLPTVKAKFREGGHYIVNEILWTGSLKKGQAESNWRILLEPKSIEILYIRAFVGDVTAMVYDRDPQTQTGDVVPSSTPVATLDSYRNSVTLSGLTLTNPQQGLVGEYVEILDLVPIAAAPPTVPSAPGDFTYSADTDEFSAVNAYYHVDRCFRTMVDYGYVISTFFPNTTFPIPVDHRGENGGVNAHCYGNTSGNGIGSMTYGKIAAGDNLGIATANRIVWHEFGHGILYDHVAGPNFGFAHSAGDSMAIIMNDPGSNEVDRFDTFPFVQDSTSFGRRHDRSIAAGWAWFGPSYNTQYNGEQILATTLFRLYRSLGGDASQLNTQIKASETTMNLIFGATGQLTSTTSVPEVFVTNMQITDLTTTNFKGVPGGALHKVVRWAFEKQGLFQPDAIPGNGNIVMAEGNPPDVDVYIDDGRGGEYEYLWNHWSCQDMWVRRAPDGGLVHEAPVVNQPNYMYVRVKNRGLNSAQNVRVDAYSCDPGTGLVFPDNWSAMTTATLPATGPIASGGEEILGPFEFTPTNVGHECLLAIAHADGDPGNDTTLTGSIDHARFVPFDNNVGQRNVNPVASLTGGLAEYFDKHVFWVRNPHHKPAVVYLEIRIPDFLRRTGWSIRVNSEGGSKFELSGRQKRKVQLSMKPGKEIDAREIRRAQKIGDATIEVVAMVNGEISGGMTYPLIPDKPSDKNDTEKDDKFLLDHRISLEDILKRMSRKDIKLGDLDSGKHIRSIRLDFDDD
jgi:hypothetical protein